ncbi:4Fe-4S dicluster domain-containing protein [Erwinia mallotivora]|uniref:4Fe-4S dicluster domain-containing protein n=1 Tax=Erwinia mallotivora TaxID=69222 RepID=UPI0021BE86E0|nr:4Fe-4S dicluster domain-containing protein [Erwinia mallotivora]
MSQFILATTMKCIGCHTCEVACAVVHAGTVAVTSQDYFPRLRVVKQNAVSTPVMCRQCRNAPCVAACPVAALQQGEQAVEIVSERCIDCKSCMIACPFGAIEIVSTGGHPQVIKCDLCAGQSSGSACVSVCPTGALTCVTSDELSQLRQQRQRQTASGSQMLFQEEWING